MKRHALLAIAGAAALLLVLGETALAAQDRYTVKIPDGLSFSEIRGYETWQYVAVSQVEGGLKIIAGNPAMLSAYRSHAPGQHKAFPDGSKVVKIEWSQVKNPASPYFAMIPDKLMSVSFIEKDSKKFPKSHGWAYAQFLYDPATATFKPGVKGVDCGNACHTAVAGNDYIFTAYPLR